MLLQPVFDAFVQQSPLSVIARATVEHAFSPSALDQLFEKTAEAGYTRELLFSTTVDLMSLVVCGQQVHVQAAFQQMRERIPVTLRSVYEKLKRIEPTVCRALVNHVAGRCGSLLEELGGGRTPLLPGYAVRILDGNHLAGTQKRLQVTRGHSAAPLPGQCLAVLDPDRMLFTDLIPCEDGHAQERSLIGEIVPQIQTKQVWIADRNFCTVDFLQEIQTRGAFFVVRRHGNTTIEARGEYSQEIETETGWASERRVWLCRAGERVLEIRQVRVRLKHPTEDGDQEVEILTNLPAEVASAAAVANLYLKRWRIEGAFGELAVALNGEVETLSYPRAALFAFAVAVVAYNLLAVVKGALRAVHGEKKVEEEVSGYYMAREWEAVYPGMMIALEPLFWKSFGEMSAQELACHLREWASKVNLLKIKKAPPRKPTKNKTERVKDRSSHVSTARLLEEAKEAKKRQQSKSKGKKN